MPSSRDRIGNTLQNFGLLLSTPLHRSSEVVLRNFLTPVHSSAPTIEKMQRSVAMILNIALAPLTIALSLAGGISECIGSLIATKPYTYIPGNAPVPSCSNNILKAMTFNGCMFWGGLPLAFGGVSPARERTDKIAELIKQMGPDILVMQEVSYGPSLDLCARLKDQYSHFFTRIGPNPFQLDSGLFIASKYPMIGDPSFISFSKHTSFMRGIFCMETPLCWILTAHLKTGETKECMQKRKEQFELVTKTIESLKQKSDKPCLLMGDLNIQRTGSQNDEYSTLGISQNYYDLYAEKHPQLNPDNATHTDLLRTYIIGEKPSSSPWDIDDYVLLDRSSRQRVDLDIQLVKDTFSLDQPEKSLSDHRALYVTAKFD